LKSLLSSTEQRRFDLLEKLYISGDFEEMNTLCKELDCSETILKTDINFLNSKYQDDLVIDIKSKTVKLRFNPDKSLGTIVEKVLNSNNMFSLLEYIFHHSSPNIVDMALNLFISSATAYRLIHSFNQVAEKEYGFTIDTGTVEFSGEELSIRCFFVQFFAEKYNSTPWPFKDVNRETLVYLVDYIYKFLGWKQHDSFMEEVVLICAVNLTRFKQGHELKELEVNVAAYRFLDYAYSNDEISKVLDAVSKSLGVKNERHSFIQIFFTFLHKDASLSGMQAVEPKDDEESFSSNLTCLLKILYNLMLKYNLALENFNDIVLNIHNGSLFYNVRVHSNPLLYRRNHIFLERMKMRHPELIKDVLESLEKYLKNSKDGYTKEKAEYLAYILMTAWKDFLPQVLKVQKLFKILLISKFDYFSNVFMKNQLDFFFKNFVDTHVFEQTGMEFKDIKNSDYDLIVSDFTLPKDIGKKWIYLNGFNTYAANIELISYIYGEVNKKSN